MYCPVDGDEFREGITRCPAHDVDLLREPPERDEETPWTARIDGVFLRTVLGAGVLAGLVYGIAGAAAGIILALISRGGGFGSSSDPTFALLLQDISRAAFPVVIGAVGILGGALLFRAYSNLRPGGAANQEPERTIESPPRFGTEMMRVLFGLSIVFILMWAATGAVLAKDQVEYAYAAAPGVGGDEPDGWFITVATLNHLAYFAGTTCLLLMGIRLALTAYLRLESRGATTEPS